MELLIKRATVGDKVADILIKDGLITDIGDITSHNLAHNKVIDAKGLTALPAFVDMHAHFREPGQEYKEDILSGALAAVKGGFSAVMVMPNTNPVVDNPYLVEYIVNRSKRHNLCKVYPIGAITIGLKGEQLAELKRMKECGAVAFSDDGKPVSDANTMKLALEYAKDLDLLIISHSEDASLVDGGVVNEGYNATIAGLKGITRASEEVSIARELILAKTTGARIHIAHVSTAGSVDIIRYFKKQGVRVTAETCPHYFSLTDDAILSYDTATKVNPPLREASDVRAIIEGLKDGTLDCIATDHAPHSELEKSQDYNSAPFGISGIESAFSLAYTELVAKGHITLDQLSTLMTENPSKISGIPSGKLEVGGIADLVLVDCKREYSIDKNDMRSKGKNTPFDKKKVLGRVEYTLVNGEIKYSLGEAIC